MNQRNSGIGPIAIIGILFFIFGFVTWLNGILIPFLKISCELTNFEAYFVTTAFYISYFVMALPSSWVLRRTGLKKGMSLGLLIMALGTLVFIPAAYSRTYWVFLLGLFVQGTGLAILQTSSNPYLVVLGPRESAARRISIMGICNKAAGGLAPLILAAFVIQAGDQEVIEGLSAMSLTEKAAILDSFAARVVNPYLIMAVVLVVLSIGLYFMHLPDTHEDTDNSDAQHSDSTKHSVFAFPNLVFGVLTLFLYVGVEVIAGDSIINYGSSLGIPLDEAKLFTTFTLVAMIAGYILGALTIPNVLKQQQALAIAAALGVLFTVLVVTTSGFTSVLFVALLGFSNSIMWPAIFPLSIDGLGRFTKTGSAILVMAIAGGALMPLLYGRLADTAGTQAAYWICLPAYLVILWFALAGYKIRSWKK